MPELSIQDDAISHACSQRQHAHRFNAEFFPQTEFELSEHRRICVALPQPASAASSPSRQAGETRPILEGLEDDAGARRGVPTVLEILLRYRPIPCRLNESELTVEWRRTYRRRLPWSGFKRDEVRSNPARLCRACMRRFLDWYLQDRRRWLERAHFPRPFRVTAKRRKPLLQRACFD